jgi:hypothetical protein
MARPKTSFEADAATNVIGSGLLRVLTDQSRKETSVVTEPLKAEQATKETPAPVPTLELTEMVALPEKPRPIMIGAAIVAAIVIVADVGMVVVHRRAASPNPSPSLPTYVVLPETAPPVHPVLPDPPTVGLPATSPPPPAWVMPVEEPKPTARAHHHHHHHLQR